MADRDILIGAIFDGTSLEESSAMLDAIHFVNALTRYIVSGVDRAACPTIRARIWSECGGTGIPPGKLNRCGYCNSDGLFEDYSG